MLAYNVFFKVAEDIELSVFVKTNAEDREQVIQEARFKLKDKGFDEFTSLDVAEVNFVEEI